MSEIQGSLHFEDLLHNVMNSYMPHSSPLMVICQALYGTDFAMFNIINPLVWIHLFIWSFPKFNEFFTAIFTAFEFHLNLSGNLCVTDGHGGGGLASPCESGKIALVSLLNLDRLVILKVPCHMSNTPIKFQQNHPGSFCVILRDKSISSLADVKILILREMWQWVYITTTNIRDCKALQCISNQQPGLMVIDTFLTLSSKTSIRLEPLNDKVLKGENREYIFSSCLSTVWTLRDTSKDLGHRFSPDVWCGKVFVEVLCIVSSFLDNLESGRKINVSDSQTFPWWNRLQTKSYRLL